MTIPAFATVTGATANLCCPLVVCHSMMYFFQPKQKIPKVLSIVLSKVLIGDQESVEKTVPNSSLADMAIWADRPVLTDVTSKGRC